MRTFRPVRLQHRPRGGRSRTMVAAVAAIALALSAVTALGIAQSAQADTAPAPGAPATVSADALPTVQQNGVIWAQVTVGNIVYATGSFTYTWPAGLPNVAANRTPRANLLAYDITTGNLTSFNHSLNSTGLSIAVTSSATNKKIIVGGNFTSVDGQTRNRLVAFDVATGALVSTFKPSMDAGVAAIAAGDSTVFIGGIFSRANGVVRTRLAALRLSDGATLPWSPTADDNKVTAMVLTPDHSEVVIGGRFTTLSGVPSYGLGAVRVDTGFVVRPYPVNDVIRDYGANAGIVSLATDGNLVYGSGYTFGAPNFEGTFAISPNTGTIKWLNDCHGDTYSVYPIGSVLYSVSHAHNCQWMQSFPQSVPETWHKALAFTTYATGGVNIGPDDYGWNFNGQPTSSLLQWFPDLADGTVTGQNQAAWSVTGNSSYISLGGEFPTVNGTAQAGLVRFAVSANAPNRSGPVSSAALKPTITRLGGGAVKLVWAATWDRDNAVLTYRVIRDGVFATPAFTTTATSNFWTLPTMTWTNSGLVPGSSHTYLVRAYDPFGNMVTSSVATVTV